MYLPKLKDVVCGKKCAVMKWILLWEIYYCSIISSTVSVNCFSTDYLHVFAVSSSLHCSSSVWDSVCVHRGHSGSVSALDSASDRRWAFLWLPLHRVLGLCWLQVHHRAVSRSTFHVWGTRCAPTPHPFFFFFVSLWYDYEMKEPIAFTRSSFG